MTTDEVLPTSKACCTLPPVQVDYTPKGHMTTIAGFDTYAVGDPSSQKAIIGVYDVFGLDFPQVKQGADMLSTRGYYVVIPDLFRGEYLKSDKIPAFGSPIRAMATFDDETKQKMFTFFSTTGSFTNRLPDFLHVARTLAQSHAQIASYGLCWGGKLIIQAATQHPSLLTSIAQLHPARMDVANVEHLSIPLASLISDDEPADVQARIEEIVRGKGGKVAEKSLFVHYEGMYHGFAGSRADLKDPAVYKSFTDAYNRVAEFFDATF
ncbi:hypothetical protein HDV00_010562 [Rhizophlyctis rosea]|nr:hypothetical protein HDV00_010562 [Rhizophlyctis rosea]